MNYVEQRREVLETVRHSLELRLEHGAAAYADTAIRRLHPIDRARVRAMLETGGRIIEASRRLELARGRHYTPAAWRLAQEEAASIALAHWERIARAVHGMEIQPA